MNGLTIMVLSFNRMAGLRALLKGILKQELGDIKLELIICNNSQRHTLKQSLFSRVGRLLKQFDDIKIFNSSHNWRDTVRYPLISLAKYETVFVLDDDVLILDNTFIRDMYQAHQSLGKYDILSCWNNLWKEWTDQYLDFVGVNLFNSDITEITRCDTCGTGISMYNRELVMNPRVLEVVVRSEYPAGADIGFGLISQMVWGGNVYYFPAHDRLSFHKQFKKGAIHEGTDYVHQRGQIMKALLEEGYSPVMNDPIFKTQDHSNCPELYALENLPTTRNEW